VATELAKPFRLTSEESSIVGLFKANTPSVVYITNLAVRRDQFTLDIQRVPQVRLMWLGSPACSAQLTST